MAQTLYKEYGFCLNASGLAFVAVILKRLIREDVVITDGDLDSCMVYVAQLCAQRATPQHAFKDWQAFQERRLQAGVDGGFQRIATYDKISRMIACSSDHQARDLAKSYDQYAAVKKEQGHGMGAVQSVWATFDLQATVHNREPGFAEGAIQDVEEDDLYTPGSVKGSPIDGKPRVCSQQPIHQRTPQFTPPTTSASSGTQSGRTKAKDPVVFTPSSSSVTSNIQSGQPKATGAAIFTPSSSSVTSGTQHGQKKDTNAGLFSPSSPSSSDTTGAFRDRVFVPPHLRPRILSPGLQSSKQHMLKS